MRGRTSLVGFSLVMLLSGCERSARSLERSGSPTPSALAASPIGEPDLTEYTLDSPAHNKPRAFKPAEPLPPTKTQVKPLAKTQPKTDPTALEVQKSLPSSPSVLAAQAQASRKAAVPAFVVEAPKVSVQLSTDVKVFQARPAAPTGDAWLNGPLVHEWRSLTAPAAADGSMHPFLRVLFDCRVYRDGAARVDVTVENTLDVAGATAATYDVDIQIDGRSVFRRQGVTHSYLTRWRKVFFTSKDKSAALAAVTPDLEPFHQAGALPRYLPNVTRFVKPMTGPKWDILQNADLTHYMPMHGGRHDLAPYPDWAASFIAHREATQLAYLVAQGDLAGSWPVHVREANGRLVSIDERPNFWLDGRADDKPRGNLEARGSLIPDNAHQPSLAYIPYLVTGDRYLADETAFWANFGLLNTWQDAYYNGRGGSRGLLKENEVRGYGWVLRNLSDAASYLPDDDPIKRYLAEKVRNNLDWLDAEADKHTNPLGTLWEDKRPENQSAPAKAWIGLWEQNYLAWAIDRANQHGFNGGLRHRDRIARLQLSLFTSPEYPRPYAAPYILAVGDRTPSGIRHYASLREVFQNTYAGGKAPAEIKGYWGVDARLMLLIGIKEGWPGARAAYDWLHPQLAREPFIDGVPDLVRRAGWALAAIEEPKRYAAPGLANYQFTAGWATFGLALPPGAAKTGVRVGDWPTQVDVKARWPDGTIRFAVVTVSAAKPGQAVIHAR